MRTETPILVRGWFLFAIATTTMLGGCSDGSDVDAEHSATVSAIDLTSYDPIVFGQELMRITNLDRESLGFGPMYVDDYLSQIARDKAFACPSNSALILSGRSMDMATRNYFSHQIQGCTQSNGTGYTVLDVIGSTYNTFRGENIGLNNNPIGPGTYIYGCDSSGANCQGTTTTAGGLAAIQAAFMTSPDHRSNILGDYDRFGCGVARTSGGLLYYTCIFSKGGPNAVSASATTGTVFAPLNPTRLLDTRIGNGLAGAFVSGTPRTLQVAGRGGVPANALAITGNVTVTAQTSGGYVALEPEPSSTPSTSTINFPLNDTRANGVAVPLKSGTLSAVFRGSGGAQTHLILDVTGYFYLGTSGTTYTPLTPARLLDTRVGNGLSGEFVSKEPRTFQVTGRGGVPSDAVAVTGNLAVTAQTGGGYVALGPVPTSTPSTSTLNFPAGDTRANNVTVSLGAGGTLSAVAVGASTALIFDVTGYFVPGTGGAVYVPLTPARLLDTRVGNGLSGPFATHAPRTFQVTGRGMVPADALGVTGNLAVTGETSGGYVTLSPVPTSTPSTSTLNFPSGDTRANGAATQLGDGGTLSAVFVGTSGASTALIYDVTGFFHAAP